LFVIVTMQSSAVGQRVLVTPVDVSGDGSRIAIQSTVER